MVKIAVLGAGVNGLACALRIKEKYQNYNVVLISTDFTPNTTGDGSGGLWYPYLCGNTPEPLLYRWGKETYGFLHQLWLEGGHDICLMPIYALYREKQESRFPEWTRNVFGYRELDEKHLQHLRKLHSVDYRYGLTYTTFIVPPPKLLAELQRQFADIGGQVVRAEIASLQDPILKPFDVVVNCTGLGAAQIVPDERVYPVRGQIMKVIAPWINETVMDEDIGYYMIPNSETCVLGGTHQVCDANRAVDENDKDFILEGCQNINKGLKHATIVSHWVGLRPCRDEVRLEGEWREGKLYIHNYGHGGSGLTLFWGCATDVLNILEDQLKNKKINGLKSKL